MRPSADESPPVTFLYQSGSALAKGRSAMFLPCYIGASFLPPHEGVDRHRIGVDKLMWGSHYPHLEGTWPNTTESLRATFGEYPEHEIRSILGTNAAEVYGFDTEALAPVVEKHGRALADIVGPAGA